MPSTTPAQQSRSEVFSFREQLHANVMKIDFSVCLSTDSLYQSPTQAESITIKVKSIIDLEMKNLDRRIHKKSRVNLLGDDQRTQYIFFYEDKCSRTLMPRPIHWHGFVSLNHSTISENELRKFWRETVFNIRTSFIKMKLVRKKNINSQKPIEYRDENPQSLMPGFHHGREYTGRINYGTKFLDHKFNDDDTSQHKNDFKNQGYSFGFGQMFYS